MTSPSNKNNDSSQLIPLKEARHLVLEHVTVMPPEEVSLLNAAGRVAARDLISDIDISPFDSVAMDGYAVRSEQISHATPEKPTILRVKDEVAAGDFYEGSFADNECLRIMTGAPAPACANAVVKYEIVDIKSGDGKPQSLVSFSAPADKGANIRPAGAEAGAGEIIVRKGELINSAGIGFLAGCGVTKPIVYARPRVAIIATGSELVPPDTVPTKGQIRNSNSYAIAAAASQAGALPDIFPIYKDHYDELRDCVDSAAAHYDCVLTTGGAANGDFDFIEPIVKELGEVFVTSINMRPGKAETFGLVRNVPIFGLPGNPAAAYIGFQMLARPALRKMQGYECFERPRVRAYLACDIRAKKDARMTLSRAIIRHKKTGGDSLGKTVRVVEPIKNQSSGLFGPLQKSNALLVLPRGDRAYQHGEEVECILLDVSEDAVL